MSSSWLSASLVLSPARDVVRLRMLLFLYGAMTVPMSCDIALAHALLADLWRQRTSGPSTDRICSLLLQHTQLDV